MADQDACVTAVAPAVASIGRVPDGENVLQPEEGVPPTAAPQPAGIDGNNGAAVKPGRALENAPAGPVKESVRLLRRNPMLVKVILAVGFQAAAADFAGTMDLGPDANQTWKTHTASYSALFSVAASLVALLSGPLFGRFSDKVDRRIAFLVYSFITFIPTFVYWPFLENEHMLLINKIATVVAALGRASAVPFVLSTDFTRFEDRALAAGLFYGLTGLMTVLLSSLPAFIIVILNPFNVREFVGSHQRSILVYQSGLIAGFLLCTWMIAKPEPLEGEDGELNDNEASTSKKRFLGWNETIKLLRRDERLRRLSVTALLLSLASALAIDSDGQFFCQSLGLFEDAENKSWDFISLNVLTALATHLMVLPVFLLAGYFAMLAGPLKQLRRSIPFTALILVAAFSLRYISRMWLVPAVVAVQAFYDLYDVPLMRMAAGIARPMRVGEWVAIVGLAKELGEMIGNLLVFILNDTLRNINSDLIWLYYPTAAILALMAIIPLLGKPAGTVGWGAAAGCPLGQFTSMIHARTAGTRWRSHMSAKLRRMRQKAAGLKKPAEASWENCTEGSVTEESGTEAQLTAV